MAEDVWGEAYSVLNSALEKAKDAEMTEEEVLNAVNDVYGESDYVPGPPKPKRN